MIGIFKLKGINGSLGKRALRHEILLKDLYSDGLTN